MNNLAENIKRLRVQRRLTQKELATAARTSHSRISEIESGIGNPTMDSIEKIAKALGVEISLLFIEKKSDLGKIRTKSA